MEKIQKANKLYVVILGLLLLVLGGLIYLYFSQTQNTPQTNQNQQPDQSSTIENEELDTDKEPEKRVDAGKLVKDSFEDYFDEVNTGDEQKALENFKKHVTNQVATQLDEQEAVDPVLCTQTAATKISFAKPVVSGSVSQVTVTTNFEGGTVQTAVGVDTKTGKIVSLQCLTTAG